VGAKGIGAGIVRACAGEGAVPVIIERDADSGKQLQAEIAKHGKCGLVTGELSTPQTCQQAVDQTTKMFGRLDALVNNAGVNDSIGLEKGTPSDYIASLNRNLVHYYCMAHYALPHL
jgi:L-fucose dehydrogenase